MCYSEDFIKIVVENMQKYLDLKYQEKYKN